MARKRYKTKRMDYRKGGRVSLKHGGKPNRRDYGSRDAFQVALEQWRNNPAHSTTTPAPAPRPAPVAQPAPRPAPVAQPAPRPAPVSENRDAADSGAFEDSSTPVSQPARVGAPVTRPRPSVVSEEPDISGGSDGRNNPDGGVGASGASGGRGPDRPKETPVVAAGKVADTRNIYTAATEAKLAEAKKDADALVAGTATLPKIPDAVTLGTGESLYDPNQTQAGKIQSIKETPGATAATVGAPGTRVPVSIQQQMRLDEAKAAGSGQAVTTEQQDDLTSSSMTAAQTTSQDQVIGASGSIGTEALAKAAQVDKVAPIEGANVTIPEGALAARVTGTISPQAISIAAQAAGTTLSRVTRAKKQLRNSGMSEQAITDLGNDPEALEDRLMDLTEAERGVIGDLPEEALVSNQLDSLLKGMENGEIPTWASPAVAAVEQMLAQRGLSASTVGRDNLFNAIIQSAVPIAQANAQAIQANVAQSRELESREELTNVQLRQQTAMQNASNVFQMDMAQFSADQQTTLSNSKFMQTVGLTEASMDQQATLQTAVLLSQANLAEADFYQKSQIQNAQAFLSMDMVNLTNAQQATVLTAQQKQQTLLSNTAAQNVARQFNATSENQTQQFMASLAQQVSLNNTAQLNSMEQFNTQISNQAAMQARGLSSDENKLNAQLATQVDTFNTQLNYDRSKWNATNAQAVEQSNVAWRRQANTINTAAQNQINMQNAQNLFGMSSQAQAFLWQELRDRATYEFQAAEKYEDRKTHLLAQALSNEATSASYWESINNSNLSRVFDTLVKVATG